jgi:hypothetical protein
VTGGLGLIFEPDLSWQPAVGKLKARNIRDDKSRNLRGDLDAVFKRDWNSAFAERLAL